MPSYAIIGASRGLGYAFLQVLAKDPNNVLIGTARNVKAATDKSEEDGLKGVKFVEGDMLSRESLVKAAAETAKITGGALDYLIVNGAYGEPEAMVKFLDQYEDEPEKLERDLELTWKTNTVGTVHSINAFLPLIKKGAVKKVLVLSSGLADDALTVEYDIWEGAAYSASKAGLNTFVAKYAARYKKEGILFLAVSPGTVDTSASMPEGAEVPAKFMKYQPNWKGLATPEDAAKDTLAVLEDSTVENGKSGGFVSQFGNKQWL